MDIVDLISFIFFGLIALINIGLLLGVIFLPKMRKILAILWLISLIGGMGLFLVWMLLTV